MTHEKILLGEKNLASVFITLKFVPVPFLTKHYREITVAISSLYHAQVFVHGEDLDAYFRAFSAEILPPDFSGKGPNCDGKVTAVKLFGSEDTLL